MCPPPRPQEYHNEEPLLYSHIEQVENYNLLIPLAFVGYPQALSLTNAHS